MHVSPTSRSRAAIVALHLVLPLAAFAWVCWQPDWSTENVFRCILFGEAGMLCVWSGLSTQRSGRRAAACVLGLAVCFTLLRIVDQRYPAPRLVESLLYPGATTLAFTLAIRSSSALGDDPGAPRWQFTVGQLLVITSAIAVAIALLQWFWKSSLVVDRKLMASEGAQISLVIMTWAALPRRWRIVRITAAAVLVLAVGFIVQSFVSRSWFWEVVRDFRTASAAQLWEDFVSIPLITLMESLLAAATLVLFYRLPGQRRPTG